MSTLRIGTFNCENMFTRYQFLDEAFSGKHYVDFLKPVSGADSLVTFGPGRDDVPLPREITRRQRRNTAEVILKNKPDIVAVQEVENLPTMRLFNTHYLQHHFKYAVLIEGNDSMRMIDVGLYSNFPIVALRTHMFEEVKLAGHTKPSEIFSRDCLEVDVSVGGTLVTFLVNHFKAQEAGTRRRKKSTDVPSDDVLKREAQAARVAEIAGEALKKSSTARFAVLGDLNSPPPAQVADLKALYDSKALVPVEKSLDGMEWTHFESGDSGSGKVSKLDYVFLSPALAKQNPSAKLLIERGGLAPGCKQYTGPRFPGVNAPNTEASDHCGVFLDLKI